VGKISSLAGPTDYVRVSIEADPRRANRERSVGGTSFFHSRSPGENQRVDWSAAAFAARVRGRRGVAHFTACRPGLSAEVDYHELRYAAFAGGRYDLSTSDRARERHHPARERACRVPPQRVAVASKVMCVT